MSCSSSSGSGTANVSCNTTDSNISVLCKMDYGEHSDASYLEKQRQQHIPSLGSLQNRKVYHRLLMGRIDSTRSSYTYAYYEDEHSIDLAKERADPDFDPSMIVGDERFFNWRGCSNTLVLVAVLSILLGLFLALPIGFSVPRYMDYSQNGQSPVMLKPGGRLLIDPDTPLHDRTRTSMEGETWQLVFSDEFNTPGRTFYPGDEPFWEAVDLHYWATKDYEWYSPDMVRTVPPGYLQITMEKRRTHNLDYVSGMLQSWDKLCFTGGMFEVNVSLPGPPDVPGFWPGVWMLGNLARAGYGASTEGVWPYSYDSCDAGVTKNQSRLMKSYLPGQRLNRCTCPTHIDKTEHPSPGRGRGAPEIDVLEATGADDKFGDTAHGSVSQSVQFAPFDDRWQPNASGYKILNQRAHTIGRNGRTIMNPYRGSEWQQAVSALTQLDTQVYEGRKFQTYAMEYVPSKTKGKQPYIRWLVDGEETWRMYEDAVGPNKKLKIGQRLISMEPMSLIINFGMSSAFGAVDTDNLPFPSHFLIDYVRYYQSPDRINIDCSPPDFPTAEYIKSHYNAYINPNLTTFAEAGYSFPSFSVNEHCS